MPEIQVTLGFILRYRIALYLCWLELEWFDLPTLLMLRIL